MFPRWVQPSALGTLDREPRLEEPSLRGPARDGLGECVLGEGCGKGPFWGSFVLQKELSASGGGTVAASWLLQVGSVWSFPFVVVSSCQLHPLKRGLNDVFRGD